MTAETRLETLCRLERELHQPRTRKDLTRLDQLLHPDFREIGRSGQTYTRADMLEHLAEESPGPLILATDFQLLELAPGVCLLNYRSAHETQNGRTTRKSLRTSIWREGPEGWQMVFHQGTPSETAG